MKILVSNDDGVLATGIQVLAHTLSDIAEVFVMAPDRDRSGASNSLTLDRPLRVEKAGHFFAVNGTPTDCVHLGVTGWLAAPPDMVISGINEGANLGDDVLYSGTVAAAMEGRFLGYPAMAVSLVCNGEAKKHYETAAIVAKRIIEHFLTDPLPAFSILNVNVPNVPLSEINGMQVTRLGHRHIAEAITSATDPRGKVIYWIGPAGEARDAGEGTDFYAIQKGCVSITPIKVDLTNHTALEGLSVWTENLNATFKKVKEEG